MTDPVYAIFTVLHIIAAIIGFGAIGMTGVYAAQARRSINPLQNLQLQRYFRGGRNLAARMIVIVPILGFCLLGLNHQGDATAIWPWVGLALWLVAISVAMEVLWPAESSLQAAFGDDLSPAIADEQVIELAQRAERASALISCCFVAALVVMIAQP